MSHPNKRRGTDFEREIVKLLQHGGFKARRAWGSDGRSLGLHEEVDVIFEDSIGVTRRVQAKRRKQLPDYISDTNWVEVDMVVVREERSAPLVVLPLSALLQLYQPQQPTTATNGTSTFPANPGIVSGNGDQPTTAEQLP